MWLTSQFDIQLSSSSQFASTDQEALAELFEKLLKFASTTSFFEWFKLNRSNRLDSRVESGDQDLVWLDHLRFTKNKMSHYFQFKKTANFQANLLRPLRPSSELGALIWGWHDSVGWKCQDLWNSNLGSKLTEAVSFFMGFELCNLCDSNLFWL